MNVICSNATKVNRFQFDYKEYVWKQPHKQIQMNRFKQTMKHGGGSIMVWCCFTWWNVGPLVKINGIMKKEYYLAILQTNLPDDFLDKCAYSINKIIFQQDGVPQHIAKIVKECLQAQTFQKLKRPAQSPDLNPIENLSAIVKRNLAQYKIPSSDLNELWIRIIAVVW